MGFYGKVRELWKSPRKNLGSLWNERLISWRNEASVNKIERPTRIDRARGLGYKAKQGISVARVRVKSGGKMGKRLKGGRKTRNYGRRKNLSINYKSIAEQRAAKKYKNLAVLNSYYVGHDGKHYWFEVIMVDPSHPVIISDKNLNWITSRKNTKRVFNGKTSSFKK